MIQLQFTRPLDRLVYDTFNKLFSFKPPQDIVIIAIDERSLLEFGRWPWPREKHVQLINLLAEVELKALAIDIIFSEPDTEYPDVDRLLAQAITDQGRVILPVFMGQTHRGGQLFEVKPLPLLANAAAGMGHVHIEIDSDGIARSVFLKEGVGEPYWQHFSAALFELVSGPGKALPGLVDKDVLSQPSAISIIRSHKNYFPLRPPGSFEAVSYADVLSERIPIRTFSDKIVFIGATAPGLGDNISTASGLLSGVEINANIFDALRQGNLISTVSPVLISLVSIVFVGLILWLISRFEPKDFLFATLLVIIAVVTFSLALLLVGHRWVTPVPVVMTFVLAYPLWNWWRLEKAIAYLRQQLGKFAKEQPEQQCETVVADVIKGLQFLFSLEVIRGWSVCKVNGDVYQGAGQIRQAKLEGSISYKNQWQHYGRVSSCLAAGNKADKESFEVLVEWFEKSNYLQDTINDILPLNNVVERRALAVESEVVEQIIQRLSRAEQKVDAQRRMVDQSLSQLSSGVILAGFDGHCILVNEQTRQLFAMDIASGSLMDFLSCIDLAGKTSWPVLLRGLMFNGESFSCEGIIVHSTNDVLCHGSLVNISEPLMLFNIVDVSDLKRSQRKRADALNFLSHDLRAPLTSVLALIDAARAEHTSQININLLDSIENYIQRNLSYAENYIHLAKLEATGVARRDVCEAHSLIDNAVAQIFHYAKAKGIALHSQEYDQEQWLSCDRSLIERALVNLIDNAVKFSAEKSVVSIGLQAKQDSLVFSISDQGPGIDGEELSLLFDSFHQGETTTSGVGLGLKFVAEVSAAHSGQIYVESELGKGSTFFFALPYGVEKSAAV